MTHSREAAGPGPTFPRWALFAAVPLFAAAAFVYAFTTSFSYFADYDDEGLVMLSVRGFLEGHALYDDVFIFFGPFFFFYQWILHGLLSLPLTNDMARVMCLVYWLGAAALLAIAGGRLTRSVLVSFLVFTLTSLHLIPLAREPGHPQELVAVLLGVAILVADRGWQRRWGVALLGGIGAALLFTKANVGACFVLALVMAGTSQWPLLRTRPVWFWIFLIVAGLAPWILMRPSLDNRLVLVFCVQACIAIMTAGAMAYVWGGATLTTPLWFVRLAAATGGPAVMIVVVALFLGSSVSAMLDQLIIGPSQLGRLFSIPLNVPYSSWSGAAALIAAAIVIVQREKLERLRPGIAAAKALYGVIGAVLLLNDYNRQLGYLLPWTWLLLVPAGSGRAEENRPGFGRILLCMQAVWQSLQAYPVAGTQAVMATVLTPLACSICLYDAITMLAVASRKAFPVRPQLALLLKPLALAGLLFIFVFEWGQLPGAWRFYRSATPLELRGAGQLRLEEDRVATFRALAKTLESGCDTFIAIPGMNSLYFWAGKKPPTYLNIFEYVFLNDAQQERVIDALRKSPRPLVLLRDGSPPGVAGNGPLKRLIETQCREVGRIGRIRILAPEFERAATDQPR